MPNLFKHPANLAIASLNQRDFIPRILGFSDQANLSRSSVDGLRPSALHAPRPAADLSRLALDANAPAKLGDIFLAGAPADFYQVSLRHMRRSASQLIGKFTIVRQQKQTFAGIVEPSHGINALAYIAQQRHHCGTPL